MLGFKDVAELADEYFQHQPGYSEPSTKADGTTGIIAYSCRRNGAKTTIFYYFEDRVTVIFTNQRNTAAEKDFSDILTKAGINACIEPVEREWGLFATGLHCTKPHADMAYKEGLTGMLTEVEHTAQLFCN